jgi:hypothetical protein
MQQANVLCKACMRCCAEKAFVGKQYADDKPAMKKQ